MCVCTRKNLLFPARAAKLRFIKIHELFFSDKAYIAEIQRLPSTHTMAPYSRSLAWFLIIARTSAFQQQTLLPIAATTASKSIVATAKPLGNTINKRSGPLRMIGSILDLLGGGDGGMIKPENALKGRPEKMAGITGLKHYVLGNDLEEVPEGYEVAVFANGESLRECAGIINNACVS